MGDGDRTALCDLLLEVWYYRTVATQHIAETRGDKLSTLVIFLKQLEEQRLYIDFSNTLRGSHDIGWINSLIGGYHDKSLYSIFHR